MTELLTRYHSEDAPGTLREYAATKPLVCAGDATLGSTTGRVDLVAVPGIRIPDGATLTLDNLNLVIMGPPPCITVERGGTLRILRWNAVMTTMPTEGMILVEKGGTLLTADGVTLPTGMVIAPDTPPDAPPDILPPTEPAPEPTPELIPVEGIFEPILYVSCGTGRIHVEADLPTTVKTLLSGGLAREVGVRWDLSELDCDTPGTYLIYGDFISESLADKGASNPKGLRPAVSLTLLESSPVRDLSWRAIGPSGASVPTLQLAFAALPADVEHLYLSRSADGINWRRCVRTDATGRPDGEDFLSAVRTNKATSFLIYKMPTEFDVLYLRLEVVGSVRAGSSSPILVRHSNPDGALGSGGPNSDEEDGSSGGNRGGGGQGQADRVEQQQPPTESPELSVVQVVATPTKDKPESAPDGDAYQPTEITTQASPDTGAADFTESHTSSRELAWSEAADSGGGGAVSDVAEAVNPKDLDTQKEEASEVSAAGAVVSLPEPVLTDPVGLDEAIETPAGKPHGSADRNGAVLFVSLALFGGIAVIKRRGN